MAFATVDDVLTRWVGSDLPADATVDAFIRDAETIIRFEYADIDDRIDEPVADGGVPADSVRFVVCRMVIRAIQNPAGLRSETEGPFGVTFAGANPGSMFLTNEERDMLNGTPASGGMVAFSINAESDSEAGYIGVEYSTEPDAGFEGWGS